MTKMAILMATVGIVFSFALDPAQAQNVAGAPVGEAQRATDCESIRAKIRQLELDRTAYETSARAAWAQYTEDKRAAAAYYSMEQQELRMSQAASQDGRTDAANSHYLNAKSYMTRYQDAQDKIGPDLAKYSNWLDKIASTNNQINELRREEAAVCTERTSGMSPAYELGGPSMPLGGLDPAPQNFGVLPGYEPGGPSVPLGGLGPLPPVYRDKNGKLIINMPVGNPDDLKKTETPAKTSALPENAGTRQKTVSTLLNPAGGTAVLTTAQRPINVAPDLRAYFASLAQMNGRVLLTGKTSGGAAGSVGNTDNKNANETPLLTASSQHGVGSSPASREIHEPLAMPHDISPNISSASHSSDVQLQTTERKSSSLGRASGLLHGLRLR
jgi:hypothetical protein